MHSSRIVSRSKRRVIVDQSGEARLLFLSFPIQVRLEVEEFPYQRIVSRAQIEGKLQGPARGLTLSKHTGAALLLHYTGSLTAGLQHPAADRYHSGAQTPWKKRFGAMVDEIMRRQRLRETSRDQNPPAVVG